MDKLLLAILNDFRLIFRDNSLKLFLALPLISLPVIRYGIPYVIDTYPGLQDYTDVILMLATMQGAVAFGFIYSMVLVDEKDTNVGKVYGVLPVSKFWFAAFRLLPPYFLAAISTSLLLLVEPFFGFPIPAIILYSAVAGLAAPFMIMFVAILASNKIEAMTWQKLFNVPLYLPIAGFFVPASFTFLFGMLPSYWAYRTFDSIVHGNSFGIYATVGAVYSLVFTALMIKRFIRDHFQ